MSETKRKIAAALIALLACFLIGISAWALIGQSFSANDGSKNSPTELSSSQDNQSKDSDSAKEDEDKKEKDQTKDEDNSNSGNKNSDNGSSGDSDSSDSGNSSGSNSSSSSNSGNKGSSSSSNGQSSAASSNVKISISVTSSAVGNPVSASKTLTFKQGATVYDALCGTGLSIASNQSSYGVYVSSIGGLAEKQHGSNSGWMYSVNGSTPMTSCSNYKLSNGDSVVWYYVT